MEHKPTRDRVLIRRGKLPEQSKGGIFLPDTGKKKANFGEVVAVGPGSPSMDGKVLLPMSCQPGDKVTFIDYTEDRELGDNLCIVDDEDILSVTVE